MLLMGSSVMVLPLQPTSTGTCVVSSNKCTFSVLTVAQSNASLKVMLIVVVLAWLSRLPEAGDTLLTCGGVLSGAAPVVKLQLAALTSLLPAKSFAPVVMVAV